MPSVGCAYLHVFGDLVFQLAEVAVPRPLFAAIVERIGQLRLACASG